MRLILLAIVCAGVASAQGWEQVKKEIAWRESRNGLYRVGKNLDGSLDLGVYQIWEGNLKRAVSGKRLADAFDGIFARYGIDTTHTLRVNAVRDNDRLNEELAKEIYRQRGLKAWTSMRKK